MGHKWWAVCQLQGAVMAGNDLAGGRIPSSKCFQNYDRKLQLIHQWQVWQRLFELDRHQQLLVFECGGRMPSAATGC